MTHREWGEFCRQEKNNKSFHLLKKAFFFTLKEYKINAKTLSYLQFRDYYKYLQDTKLI